MKTPRRKRSPEEMRREREAEGREDEVYRRTRGREGQAVTLIEGDIRHNSREYIPRFSDINNNLLY